MKIYKTEKISGVIVSPENIIELTNKIDQESKQGLKSIEEKKRYEISQNFILKSTDGTQYESNDMSIFSKDGILYTRRIIAVEMQYRNFNEDKSINIMLYHTPTADDWNQIRISGDDENWTNGVFSKFKDIISNWRKQKSWIDKYFLILLILFGIGFAFVLYRVVFQLIGVIINVGNITFTESPQWLEDISPLLRIFVYFSFIKFGFDIAYSMLVKIRELYPNIEFLVGPEYLQTESQKRKKLYKIITLGVLPIIITLLFELIRLL